MLAKMLSLSGATALCSRMRSNKLIVLNYHRIYGPRHVTEFDDDVFEHSVTTFRNQLLWLRERFEMIDENRLIQLAAGGDYQLDSNAVLVTFDDGYVDNYQLAYPILKELGVPAIFFVPYNMIEKRELGWWDLISWSIGKSKVDTAEFKGMSLDLRTPQSRVELAKSLHTYVKLNDYSQTKGIVQDLAQTLRVELPSQEAQSKELMTWEQLREVSDHGVAIGSHSMSHRILAQISDEDQAWEMAQSKRLIEEKLGKPVNSIAYPVGKKTSFNDISKQLAKQAGYKAGFSFYPGVYNGEIDDSFDIRRITLASEPALYKNEVVFPGVFF